MTGTDGISLHLPMLCVRSAQPMDESRYLAFCVWADDQVPMAWHYAIGEQVKRFTLVGRLDQILERLELTGMSEKGDAAHRAVHDMEGQAIGG